MYACKRYALGCEPYKTVGQPWLWLRLRSVCVCVRVCVCVYIKVGSFQCSHTGCNLNIVCVFLLRSL